MPATSPPPPNGTTTASTSGRSSRISRPIVPLPAITASSLNAWTNSPLMPSRLWVRKVSNHSSCGTRTILPPMRSTAASFVAGAPSGTTTVHGMPRRFAFHATPCAILPALAVHTPCASWSRGMSAIALLAPRILNEPIGCRFSSLSQISAGASAPNRTSGVRTAAPAMRSRAARMSASGITATPRVLHEIELVVAGRADEAHAGLFHDASRRGMLREADRDDLAQRALAETEVQARASRLGRVAPSPPLLAEVVGDLDLGTATFDEEQAAVADEPTLVLELDRPKAETVLPLDRKSVVQGKSGD